MKYIIINIYLCLQQYICPGEGILSAVLAERGRAQRTTAQLNIENFTKKNCCWKRQNKHPNPLFWYTLSIKSSTPYFPPYKFFNHDYYIRCSLSVLLRGVNAIKVWANAIKVWANATKINDQHKESANIVLGNW